MCVTTKLNVGEALVKDSEITEKRHVAELRGLCSSVFMAFSQISCKPDRGFATNTSGAKNHEVFACWIAITSHNS